MAQTRLDTKKLTADALEALALIKKARHLLEPHLVVLTDDQRKHLLRPRDGLPGAVRALARAAEEHPNIAVASGFDGPAAVEDIANAEAIEPLSDALGEFVQLVDDSKLSWQSEAIEASLSAYGVAKVIAKTNGSVRTLIDPIAEVFVPRKPAKKAE